MEFIFAQFCPAVCLLCKQTDFTKRIIALFRVLLYRVTSKKVLKIKNMSLNQYKAEFTFSFDPRGAYKQIIGTLIDAEKYIDTSYAAIYIRAENHMDKL